MNFKIRLPRCVSCTALRHVYVGIFVLSGFSGLIYESIWTHYLKLFLGHAAYAQTLVLVIFMGGMAAGAWMASRLSTRLPNPLLAYSVTEAVTGLFGLIFHTVFVTVTDFSYFTVIPVLSSAVVVEIYKWLLSAMLITTQSVLLGMTFPFMTAGLMRRFPGRPGHRIAVLYFANSLGAAAGVLTSGFFIIAHLGLPGTIFTASLINLLIALLVYVLVRADSSAPAGSMAPASEERAAASGIGAVLLVCAAGTGMSSFMYEIGWIRMLSLVLGNSTHAFELMLSAFIFGLAIGGLWIRTSMDRLQRPLIVLGAVQIVMGVLAMATLVVYGFSFDAMQYALKALARTDQGYFFFNLFSHSLALVVMVPATICAGMTLPLITHYLYTNGVGERAIGRVYAANTIGCILGVIISIQVLMPHLGLRNLIIAGGIVDIAIGFWLFWIGRSRTSPAIRLSIVGGSVAYLAVIILGVHLDIGKMASGVYRVGGFLRKNDRILYHRDGKTASVDLVSHQTNISIRTNGKPDAGIRKDSRQSGADECTMTLLAAIPVLMKPSITEAAVIGLGSGMSTHTLLNHPGIRHVDTIEIEPAMVEAARLIGNKVCNAFEDPRSTIHIADAKTFFCNHHKSYDLILSEPSNPWVSGISGLFSQEFYRLVSRQVKPDGLFSQWLHLYEIDMNLVSSVVKSLGDYFPYYQIFGTSGGDILLLAGHSPLPDIRKAIIPKGRLGEQLHLIGIRTPQDLALLRIGDRRIFGPLFDTYAIAPNSDYYPVLDLGAVRTRFLQRSARNSQALGPEVVFFLDDVRPFPDVESLADPSERHPLPTGRNARDAVSIWQYYHWKTTGETPPSIPLSPSKISLVRAVRSIRNEYDPLSLQEDAWLSQLITLANATVPYLPPDALDQIWADLENAPCYDGLSEEMRRWIALVRGWGERDYKTVWLLTGQLLPSQGIIMASERNNFLLRLALISAIKHGDYDSARALFSRYRAIRNLKLNLRLLAAIAASSANADAIPLDTRLEACQRPTPHKR